MDIDIANFIKAIGAVQMNKYEYPESYRFKMPNYFQFAETRLIVKISKIKGKKHPFWGVGVRQIEILDQFGPYYLLLLISDREGWFLSHVEIARLIENFEAGKKDPCWTRGKNTGKSDNENQYKINPPLPNTNRFNSPQEFLWKVPLNRTGTAA